MNTAMLWFDDNPKTSLSFKIEQAIAYYCQKYGRQPNFCLLHPAMLDNKPIKEIGKDDAHLEIHCATFVQPNNFWIGTKEV